MIYTYVLKSKKDGKMYTGFSHNLQERFKQHNNGEVFSTKGRGPFELIYYEACRNEHDASMREKYLKSGWGKRYLKNRLKRSLSPTGFTLIELVVVIAIIATLSGIILFSVSQYINKGKDSNISSNLSVLIPAGEVYYNGNNNSYSGFCDPTQNTGSVLKNALLQMPIQSPIAPCYSEATTASTNPQGVCCKEATPNYDAWAACAKKFTYTTKAFCVDSRGVKEEIDLALCTANLTECPLYDH